MRIKGELSQVLNPWRTRIGWGIFYVGLTVVVLGGLYVVADHIKTHTLPTGKIQLSTPYSKYVVGETINFSITNDYNAPVYFTNQCPTEPLAVYRQTNGRWERIHDQASAKDCPDEDRQVSIPPSATVTSSFAPWHHLFDQAGKYRLVAIVNNYNSLPYVDLEVIAPPPALTVIAAPTKQSKVAFNNLTQSQIQTQSQSQTTSSIEQDEAPTAKPAAKTYVLHVNSSGFYDLTNLTLNAGDSIQIVYNQPITDEVITHFTPIAPTAGVIYVTVDHDHLSRTQQFISKGAWTFKADDHSGNRGTLTVN